MCILISGNGPLNYDISVLTLKLVLRNSVNRIRQCVNFDSFSMDIIREFHLYPFFFLKLSCLIYVALQLFINCIN